MTRSRQIDELFSYYGSKYALAPLYPAPKHDVIVEPFAGSAGYSCMYADREVHLYDTDPVVCSVWRYLIETPSNEIRALPLISPENPSIKDLDVCQEARWLIGFWAGYATAYPRHKVSDGRIARMGIGSRSVWSALRRELVARSVDEIRHWKVYEKSFEEAGDCEATWFIDPPYRKHGRKYRCYHVDYDKLSEWARSRQGQVIACEGEGGDWLPFHRLSHNAWSTGRLATEQVWSNERISSQGNLWIQVEGEV